jgi:hypothetical protein
MKLVLSACALALVAASSAAGSSVPLTVPQGLHAFEYVADEGVRPDHTYAQMPAFAWAPARGASKYELQLATSRRFNEATLVQTSQTTAPVASIQVQVPWMTGNPYALWVRVRALSGTRTSQWSTPFGFNTRWRSVPERLAAPDGLVRWSPVAGATGYEVLYLGVPGGYSVHFSTITNVADEREWWSFHQGLAANVRWRVRAVRVVKSAALPNGVPIAKYGPYSPIYTTPTSGTYTNAPISGIAATSDVDSTSSSVHPHQLMPGFAWKGTGYQSDGTPAGLWRVYVFSDKECVNPVMVGSVTGSPAWAPRDAAPLKTPGTVKALTDALGGNTYLGYGGQELAFSADGSPVIPAEQGGAAAAGAGAGDSSTGSASTTTTSNAAYTTLPDNGWPEGRYWWTVVPVQLAIFPADKTKGIQDSDKVEYHDAALPQDICAAGQVWPFGIQSVPLTTSSQTPYISGLLAGRVTSAARKSPRFSELPLITWQPAIGAQSYEIELSRKSYPWKAVRKQTSIVTSAVLNLTRSDVGTWFYRVRGVNPYLVAGAQKMTWSPSVKVRITGDEFTVVK